MNEEIFTEETEDSPPKNDKASDLKETSMTNMRNRSPETKKSESEDDFDDVILFVEYKYCTVCHIEQVY